MRICFFFAYDSGWVISTSVFIYLLCNTLGWVVQIVITDIMSNSFCSVDARMLSVGHFGLDLPYAELLISESWSGLGLHRGVSWRLSVFFVLFFDFFFLIILFSAFRSLRFFLFTIIECANQNLGASSIKQCRRTHFRSANVFFSFPLWMIMHRFLNNLIQSKQNPGIFFCLSCAFLQMIAREKNTNVILRMQDILPTAKASVYS